MRDFAALQRDLAPVWRLSQPPGGAEHVRVILPSFSVGVSALAHYADRLPALEHRFLVEILQLARVEGCELVFVLCQAPDADVLDYYLSLLPGTCSARGRIRMVVVPDGSGRPIAAKLLDRPDLIEQIRADLGDRPVMVEPWNVTEDEVAVAVRLGAPLYGTAPALWPLGFKSAGRRLFASLGVPTPPGTEDVRSLAEVEAVIRRLRRDVPGLPAVVLKLDNSVAGDGNRVVALCEPDGSPSSSRTVAERVASTPEWYVGELALGGVVEAYVAGGCWSSPSVQLEITPEGRTVVLATHEQLLGGDGGQVYLGCRFPARREYAARLAGYGRRVGEALAGQGALGMLSVDFVAARDRGQPWRLYALEINLRRGGTTPPIVALSSLLPGRYDGRGRWRLPDGSARYYCATDNLLDERWVGLIPGPVIAEVRAAGAAFDRCTGTGAVLHMLSGLAIDGRMGVIAVGSSARDAERLMVVVRAAVNRADDARAVCGIVGESGSSPRIPQQSGRRRDEFVAESSRPG